MGCCLALRCSLYLQENNKDFYDKYIYETMGTKYDFALATKNCKHKTKYLWSDGMTQYDGSMSG